MKTKKREILLTNQTLSNLQNKWLLLDTDVFIDASNFAEEFNYFFTKLKDANCTLTTISSVVVEFLRGAKSITDMSNKRAYIESIASILPTGEMASDKGAMDLIEPQFLVAYGKSGKSVSYTDYLLAKTIKNYGDRMYLITGNHQDFPTSIFDRKHVLSVGHEFEVKTYGILQFNEDKYKLKMSNLLKQEN
ncbi:MAG TPA: hypothetical protein VJI96_03225 [Candidatus Andersenbacteria bacterium]|nr:hypothetical protein [Candidatus Andersenbacteria bacterium]